jgi:ADP-ribose pyrophosphatase YjhB (NUDIX family)
VTQAERYGRLRPVCPHCSWVYFADPKVAVGVLVEKDARVLLVRRANDPKRGFWTLPAGFVDAGEDPARAAERECLEETGLEVTVSHLLDVISGQEHARGAHFVIFYAAQIHGGSLAPGDDVDQVAFFDRDELPALAFTTTEKILAKRFSG